MGFSTLDIVGASLSEQLF